MTHPTRGKWSEEELKQLWFAFREQPSWITKLSTVCSEEELLKIERWEDEFIEASNDPKYEKEHKEWLDKNLPKTEEEWKKAFDL